MFKEIAIQQYLEILKAFAVLQDQENEFVKNTQRLVNLI